MKEEEKIVSAGRIFDFLENFDNPQHLKELHFTSSAGSPWGPGIHPKAVKDFLEIQRSVKLGFAMETGTRLTFSNLSMDTGCRLCFSLAVQGEERKGKVSRLAKGIFHFTLREEGGKGEHLYTRSLTLLNDYPFGGWVDENLPLQSRPGKKITISFAFRSEEGGVPVPALRGFLAFPRLLFENREQRVGEIPIRLEVGRKDLIAPLKPSALQSASAMGVEKKVRDDLQFLAGRQIIQVQPKSSFSLSEVIPPHARLEVELGSFWVSEKTDHAGESLAFRIVAGTQELLCRRIAPSTTFRIARDWVDLSPWAGKTVSLSFLTEPSGAAVDEDAIFGWTRISIAEGKERTRELPGEGKPNLIVLLVDTLRADHLGCYGYRRKTSPSLDRFASEGVLFENCIAQSSWTLPSIATLLTGLYPGAHGVQDNERGILHSSLEVLPEQFLQRGITTVGLSSNYLIGHGFQFSRGFETFQEVFGGRAEDVNRFFQEWLDRFGAFRFFAYLHYLDPHSTYSAPDPFYNFFDRAISRKNNDETIQKLKNWERGFLEGEKPLFTPLELEKIRTLYDGEITYWDHCFAQLMKSLKERGLLENTIVVVLSDHGEEFLEHSYIGHGTNLFDELLRVPLLFRFPSLFPAGKRIKGQVELVDVPPTLYSLMNLPAPTGLQGASLFPLEKFRGKSRTFASTHHGLEFQEGKEIQFFEKTCLRTDTMKLIHHPEWERWNLFQRNSKGNWLPVDALAQRTVFERMKKLAGQEKPPKVSGEPFTIVDGDWKIVYERGEEEWKLYTFEEGGRERVVDPEVLGPKWEELRKGLMKHEKEEREIDNRKEISDELRRRLKKLGYVQ